MEKVREGRKDGEEGAGEVEERGMAARRVDRRERMKLERSEELQGA